MKAYHNQGVEMNGNVGYRVMFRAIFFSCFIFAFMSVRGESAHEAWMSAYLLMEEGSRHWRLDEFSDAATKYRAALSGFESMVRKYPDWRPELIAYRLEYCKLKLRECEERIAIAQADTRPGELREQLRREQERNGRLQAELAALQKRLGEIEQLRGQLSEKDRVIAEKDSQLAGWRERYGAKDLESERRRREIEKLKPAAASTPELRQHLAEVLVERDECRDALAASHKELAAVRGELAALKGAGVEALRKEVATLKETLLGMEDASRQEVALRKRALATEADEDAASSARYWQLLAERDGKDMEPALRAAYWYWQCDEKERSRQWMDALFQRVASMLKMYVVLGRIQLDLGNAERALALGLLSVAASPDNADALLTVGAVYLGLGDSRMGERYVRRALKVRPDHGEALMCLAVILASDGSGRKAEGRQAYEAAVKVGQRSDRALDLYYGTQKGK